jgi:hypothetical protein
VQALIEKAILMVDLEQQHLSTLAAKVARTLKRKKKSLSVNDSRLEVSRDRSSNELCQGVVFLGRAPDMKLSEIITFSEPAATISTDSPCSLTPCLQKPVSEVTQLRLTCCQHFGQPVANSKLKVMS